MHKILITGASKGIGRTIAEEMKSCGEIFVSGRNEESLKTIGAQAYCVCDLANNPEILGEFIQKNNIDILINNAGEYIYGGIEKMDLIEIEKIHKTNLIAPAYLISRAIPFMKEQNFGRIINIGSISGVMGEANASLYSSSKAGLLGLTKALALELAEYGITVNSEYIGATATILSKAVTSIAAGYLYEFVSPYAPVIGTAICAIILAVFSFIIKDPLDDNEELAEQQKQEALKDREPSYKTLLKRPFVLWMAIFCFCFFGIGGVHQTMSKVYLQDINIPAYLFGYIFCL